MSKILAVSWTADLLRYVYVRSEKNGSMHIIAAGEKKRSTDRQEIPTGSQSEPQPETQQEQEQSGASLKEVLKSLVSELGASKATLLLCINRGAVESATFTVPPATEAELPTLVRNMAARQLQGTNEDSLLDFVAFPPDEDGTRKVSAMVLPVEQQQLVQELADAAGCPMHRIIITPHALSLFAPPQSESDTTATLIISEAADAAHLLIVQNELPILSRTVRLSSDMSTERREEFVTSEIQRTLLAEDVEIGNVVLVGSEVETALLSRSLEDRYDFEIHQVSSVSLIDGDASGAAFGIYTPLVAALKTETLQITPAIDFAHPKKPPIPVNMRNRILVIAAVVVLIVGTGWYYVNSQFSEIETEIAQLRTRRSELNELVKKTRTKRNLAKVLSRWESSRIDWLDELRDLTIRIPSSPELSLQQFTATPTRKGAVVSFSGTGRSPEVIRQMEVALHDQYHQLKTPGIRERKQGKKSIWTFQTTMTVRSRPREKYLSHLTEEELAQRSSSTKKTKGKSTRSKAASPKAKTKKKVAEVRS